MGHAEAERVATRWGFARSAAAMLVPICIFLLLAAVPFAARFGAESYVLTVFTRLMILAVAALSLNLLIGYAGLVSFGHAAFIGLGAYSVGILTAHGVHSIAVSSDTSMSRIGSDPLGLPSETIALDTLDAFCRTHDVARIDYLKIDTEGHDLAVLKGGAGLLGASRAAIVQVEASMNPDNHFHIGADALAGYLNERGYRLFGVYEQTLEWTTADAYLRRANLLFVSPDTITTNHWTG